MTVAGMIIIVDPDEYQNYYDYVVYVMYGCAVWGFIGSNEDACGLQAVMGIRK
jgi:hypothetical protein